MSSSCNGDAAAYVLGALEDHEVAGFEDHMDSCAVCRDEVDSMQDVVDLLPATVPALAAPRALKRRVMTVVEAEAALARRAPDSDKRRVRGRWRPFPIFAGSMALAATAAAAIVLVAGGSGGSSTRPGDAAREANVRVVPAKVFDGATGQAALHEIGSRTELVVSRMPPPPARHIYQVWLSRPGESEPTATNALFNVASDGSATVDVPGSLRGVKAVLVTTEPLGGSRVPSGEPIISAPLT